MKPEILAASARMCGLKPSIPSWPNGLVFVDRTRWNPVENAEQNWLCLKELLKRGYWVEYGPEDYMQIHYHRLIHDDKGDGIVHYSDTCPPEEFAARALAELEDK